VNVLITGGFGLLGGRLGQYLSEKYNVVLSSRFVRDLPDWSSPVKVIEIDWNNETSLDNACKDVNVVIHASGLNAKECQENPDRAMLVNGTYTKRLVAAAARQGVKKIIYLSTVHVYSDRLTGIISENTTPTNSHPYATSHVSGEEEVLSQSDVIGLVVRISNAFGRPVSKDVDCWLLLIQDLCKQAVVNRTLVLQSDTRIIRDFVTISDVCAAVEFLIIDSDASGIVNVASGNICTIGEMATQVQSICLDMLGFSPALTFSQEPNKSKGSCHSFKIKTNYLDDNEFVFSNNFNKEIRELILFCKDSFS